MKFVSLVVIGIMISFGAAAQNKPNEAGKTAVAQSPQKKKGQKLKLAKTKVSTPKNVEVVTLKDEKAHKAKWTFEEMLRRRLEVDAEDSERERPRRQ